MPRLATLEKKHAAITGIGDDMVRYKPPTKKSLAGAIQEGFDRARAVAAVADTTAEQRGRRKQVEATPEAPASHFALLEQLLVRLGVEHCLPYSFVEWDAFRTLIQCCLLLPPCQVSSRECWLDTMLSSSFLILR